MIGLWQTKGVCREGLKMSKFVVIPAFSTKVEATFGTYAEAEAYVCANFDYYEDCHIEVVTA
jgi:hypothetical protein